VLSHLQAVAQHIGRSVASGHYATWRRGRDGTSWWLVSDEIVTPKTLDEVLRCQAYLLFHVRVEEEVCVSIT
jgi:uncharacterized UBP type Zn finger protein